MIAKFLPGFKTTFLLVGYSFILLASSLFAKGLMASMSEFSVPENIVSSPFYADAILWVYVHMLVIGVLIVCLGYSVKDTAMQTRIATLLFFITAYYTYLDFRSSDSAFGNALYKGASSLSPAILSLIFTILFLQLSIRLMSQKSSA